MKSSSCFILTFSLVLFLLIPCQKANAQFLINPKYIDIVKSGTTYVVMDDTSSDKANLFKGIYRKYWTFSKLAFVTYDNLSKVLSPDDSYLSFGETSATFHQQASSNANGYTPEENFSTSHIYFELWICDLALFGNKKKDFSNKYKIQVARIELFTDFSTLSHPEDILDADWNGDGHVRNWGPGILKNYLQHLMFLLNQGTEQSLRNSVADNTQLKKLQNDTLYVPDYILKKFNQFNGSESEKFDTALVFEDYPFPYKIISKKELNEKILADSATFYYFVYVKSSTDKYINVFNAHTGELIYADASRGYYNISPTDLKNLAKAIRK